MTDVSMYRTLGWCKAPFAGCKNDGRQFHLTHLRHDEITSSGRMNAEYDNTKHNTYLVDGEDNDIHQYHVVLEITGTDADQVAAKVFEYQSAHAKGKSEEKVLDTRASATMRNGQSFEMKGKLPRTLKVEKSGSGCGTFTFTYADPKKDGYRVFRFSSNDKGLSEHARSSPGEPLAGHYCLPEMLPVLDAKGRPKTGKDKKVMRAGTKLHCSFPGW